MKLILILALAVPGSWILVPGWDQPELIERTLAIVGGQPITLQGCSCLHWRDRVHFHQDYFDAGALLYEHLPVMGTAIRWLKGRLA